MFKKIKDARLILLAVLAIGISGLTSMAALTSQLTVTNTFNAAQANLQGAVNGGTATSTTVALFTNMVLSPGVSKYGELRLVNGGNIAFSTVSAPAPTKSGTLAPDLELAVAEAAKNANLTCDATSFTAGGVAQNGWQDVTGSYTANPPSLTAGSLNVNDFKEYCFAVRQKTGGVLTGSASYTYTVTGTE